MALVKTNILGNASGAIANTFPGTAITQTFSTADATHASRTAGAITDNTTGSAGTTLAAGVGIQTLYFTHTFIGGTSAVEPVTNWTPGYKFKILSWSCVSSVALVGAGGSRVANMEIGTTDVGTSPSTVTVVIANAAVGTVTAGTAVSGANTGTASDTFSIEIAAGGTAFTAGMVTFLVVIQNMDTADAIASLADQHNKNRTDCVDTASLVNTVVDDLQTSGIET